MLRCRRGRCRSKKLHGGSIFLICSLVALIITSNSQAEVLIGKVTSIHGNAIELNLGSEKGIKSGDSGRVYYTVKIGGQDKPIYVAKFKIIYLSEKSSMAQIEERTAEVRVGHLVEIVLSAGELEVKSDPPGAKVYVDGREAGESPVVLSDVKIGRHQIRVTKEGYEPYEVWEEIGIGRLKVIANLKKVVKEGDAAVEPGKKAEVTAKQKVNKRLVVDWTQKRFAAPVWSVGDRWTYKDLTGAIWSDEVFDIKEGLYIVKSDRIEDLSGYDKKTMNLKLLIVKSGRQVENKSTWRKILDFPIFVGKKWMDTTIIIPSGGGSEATYVCDFKIEDIEEVNTPAGAFKAFKIYYKQTNKSSGKSGWVYMWYSPEAKTWVKRELEKSPYWAKTLYRDAELISFKLK